MKYQSQLTVILAKLAREGSKLNPHATPELCRTIREGEINYLAQTQTHGHLSANVHEYIAELLLWEDLWGDEPFPGVIPAQLIAFGDANPNTSTGGRFKLPIEELTDIAKSSLSAKVSGFEAKESVSQSNTSQSNTHSDYFKGASFASSLSSIKWANVLAEAQNRAFCESILMQQRSRSRYRSNWLGPKLGWDLDSGLPNNGILSESSAAYFSVCGKGHQYSNRIDKEWAPHFRIDYQGFRNADFVDCLAVWVEPSDDFVRDPSSFQNNLEYRSVFLVYWRRKMEKDAVGKRDVPIDETWYEWIEYSNLEDFRETICKDKSQHQTPLGGSSRSFNLNEEPQTTKRVRDEQKVRPRDVYLGDKENSSISDHRGDILANDRLHSEGQEAAKPQRTSKQLGAVFEKVEMANGRSSKRQRSRSAHGHSPERKRRRSNERGGYSRKQERSSDSRSDRRRQEQVRSIDRQRERDMERRERKERRNH